MNATVLIKKLLGVPVVTQSRTGFLIGLLTITTIAGDATLTSHDFLSRNDTFVCIWVGLLGLLNWLTGRVGEARRAKSTPVQDAPAAEAAAEHPLAFFGSLKCCFMSANISRLVGQRFANLIVASGLRLYFSPGRTRAILTELQSKSEIRKLKGIWGIGLLGTLLGILLVGCEAVPRRQGSLAPEAVYTAIRLVATVPYEVAKEVRQHPESKAQFENYAKAIDAMAEQGTFATAHVRAGIRSMPATRGVQLSCRNIVVRWGIGCYRGNPLLTDFDYHYMLGAFSQAIRTGLDRTPSEVKRDFKPERWAYVTGLRAGFKPQAANP